MGKPKPTRAVSGVDEYRQALRVAGLRGTAARIAVLEHLSQSRAPMSHAEIADILEPMGFDRATAYRNLIDMTEAGLLSRTELAITSGGSKCAAKGTITTMNIRTSSAWTAEKFLACLMWK